MEPLQILIVDDSTLFRKVLKDALSQLPGIEVIGMVSNGRDALNRAATLSPDIITLDMEMPDMNGLDILKNLQKINYQGAIVMVSSHIDKDASYTIEALALGAFGLILKPSLPSMPENIAYLRKEFQPIAKTAAHRKNITQLLRGNKSKAPKMMRSHFSIARQIPGTYPEIIAIGISTGGPKALTKIIPALPENLPVPILIVQHMPKGFTAEFANSLNSKSKITVKEAEDGEPVQAGTAYIAPGGRQMKVCQGAVGKIIRITDAPPENNCRPSVDYCFRSVCDLYGGRSLAAILTGMGRDGAASTQALKDAGAKIIAQDEATSVVFGMPKVVIDAGTVDAGNIYPLHKIASVLCENLKGL